MALIKCPECGKEVSDKAVACPNCGCPVSEQFSKNEDNEIVNDKDEKSFFTVCNKCGRFDFTKTLRIENTVKSQGYPTCMWCGGEIKVLAGKKQWMKKSKAEREDIVQQEIQRVKNNPQYDEAKAKEYNTGLRPDLNLQGFCPRCASDYDKATALRKNIENCEFCGEKIQYSDMLASDFSELWDEEKKKLGIDIPLNREPLERFIMRTFLLNNDKFSEIMFNKKWHPEQYGNSEKVETKAEEKNIPKCPTCGSTNIKRITGTKRWFSTGLFGLASSNVGKTMECKNCGYKW
jgi:hypothetical protein